jgi:hypothetical protein
MNIYSKPFDRVLEMVEEGDLARQNLEKLC